MGGYLEGKLIMWLKGSDPMSGGGIKNAREPIPSIAIMTPYAEGASALAREVQAVAATHVQQPVNVILVNDKMPVGMGTLQPWEILCHIVRELQGGASMQSESQTQSKQKEGGAALEENQGAGTADRNKENKKEGGAAAQNKENKNEGDKGLQGQGEELLIKRFRRAGKRILRIMAWYKSHREITPELHDVMINIKKMNVYSKIETIKHMIGEMNQEDDHLQLHLEEIKYGDLVGQSIAEPLGILLLALLLLLKSKPGATEKNQGRRNTERWKASQLYANTINKTATMIKYHIEVEEVTKQEAPLICLDHTQYVHILQQVFPMTTKPQQAEQQDTSAAKQAREARTTTGDVLGDDGHIEETFVEAVIDETLERIAQLQQKLIEQLKIKGLVDKIKNHLNGERALIILNAYGHHINRWEETRYALSLLDSSIGAVVVTITKITKSAKEYCSPPWKPINYSVLGLYHDIVLDLTSQQKSEDNNNPKVFYDILNNCGPHEFCMQIFAHALYANPRRSNHELCKLNGTLKDSSKSLGSIANKMFMFSYSDLTKEYRSCLLHLAIFPSGCNIRRSTLIGRWVAEGLVNKEDWHSSVYWANQCFDALIDRRLVYPVNIGCTGKVKSCMVGGLVHGFITKLARKQHMVETRLSHHLAWHFSIFNDLRLRGSDRINTFLRSLSESSQLSLLKVLDLEGCRCFKKKQYYLKDICRKILLLKFLSLRGTDVTQMPSEINKLQVLEVLDIRQTKVPVSATKHIMLLKLKRLLAGNSDSNPSTSGMSTTHRLFSGVCVPHNIEKFVNLEVLSNVMASHTGQELKDIGKLWHLTKLGVVIDDKSGHLINLLRAISDLHECLRSLSISLPKGTASSRELPDDTRSHLKYFPILLESLSISGTTEKGQLLPLLTNCGNQLSKVTLGSTWLGQSDLNVLSKLPKLLCVRLQCNAYNERELTFKKAEFINLSFFIVEGSNMTGITFDDGAAPELRQIVLSFTNIEYIEGVNSLSNLEELELNNNGRLLSLFDNANQIAKVTLCGTSLMQCDLEMLAKKPNLRCLVLLDNSYVEKQLNFNRDEFPQLNLFIVNCSHITNISFNSGSAAKLEKIVWTFTIMESLSGISNLKKLKELEFKGDSVPDDVKQAIDKYKELHGNRPDYKHKKPENQDQETGNGTEEGDVAKWPLFWKSEGWRWRN